jgi:acetyl esterase/lipase
LHLYPLVCYLRCEVFSLGDIRVSKNAMLLFAAMAAISLSLSAQSSGWPPAQSHPTLPLWPGVAPDVPANPPAEVSAHCKSGADPTKDNLIAGRPATCVDNVSTPTLTLYTPQGNNTGAAAVVFPGGGYRFLAIDLEGTEVCDWLNSAGITCVLVKYRVPNSGPYPKSPVALQDAQRALGLVRQHAEQWHIDPNRIGVMGFSAGGYLAAAISTHFDERFYSPVDAADQLSCRPDFAVVVYPGYLTMPTQSFASNPDIHPTGKTPPTFIVQAEDDPVHVENAVVYFMALKEAKVPAELHIYAQGGHGYGLRRTALPITAWPQGVETWLHTIKVLPAQ